MVKYDNNVSNNELREFSDEDVYKMVLDQDRRGVVEILSRYYSWTFRFCELLSSKHLPGKRLKMVVFKILENVYIPIEQLAVVKPEEIPLELFLSQCVSEQVADYFKGGWKVTMKDRFYSFKLTLSKIRPQTLFEFTLADSNLLLDMEKASEEFRKLDFWDERQLACLINQSPGFLEDKCRQIALRYANKETPIYIDVSKLIIEINTLRMQKLFQD